MPQKLCVLFLGHVRTFLSLQKYNFINHYKQFYDVDTFCIFSDNSYLQNAIDILNPKKYIIVDNVLLDEYNKIFRELLQHPEYKKNCDFVNNLEDDVVAKKELRGICSEHAKQFFYLKKGIELIEDYEKENNIRYDIFIKTRFDFVLMDNYDLSVLFDTTNKNLDDILTCGSLDSKNTLIKAKENYNITNNYEYLKFIKKIKIDHYASRLYTKHLKNINMGGRYMKNYDVINDIYIKHVNNKNIDNLVYFNNDWFFFTLRKNMNKFKYLISSYGQNNLSSMNGNHIFSPEYQLFAFSRLSQLYPIVHLNSHQGGIFKDNIQVFNDVIIPDGLNFVNNNVKGHRNGDFLIFENNFVLLKFIIFYSYYGEKINISFKTKHPANLKISFHPQNDGNNILFSDIFNIENDVNITFNANFYGNVFMLVEIDSLNNIEITQPKINHTELIVKYLTFYTQGWTYDYAFDLSDSEKTLKHLSSKYIDSYKSVKLQDLNNIDEKKYITLNCQKKITDANPNAEKIAYFKWKPYIILKYLKSLPDNHLLIYRDCNIIKYPQYLHHFNTIKRQISQTMFNVPEGFFAEYEEQTLKSIAHQKKFVTDSLDIKHNEFFLNHNLINAATIICKKSDLAFQILSEWSKYCLNDNLINFEFMDNNFYDFRWHCSDQAVLNAVIIKMKQDKKLDIAFPYYIANNRELNFQSFTDLRYPRRYDGLILNKIPLITNTNVITQNAYVYRKEQTIINFKRSNITSSINQWLGYIVPINLPRKVSFSIRFINKIPPINDGVGLKTHNPVRIYNDWIKNAILNEWCDVSIVISPTSQIKEDLIILIFDGASPNTEMDINNFIIE